MSDVWIAFLGGIVSTLVAGFLASLIQRHNEKLKLKSRAQFDIYMCLLDISQSYFWVMSAEMRNEEVDSDIKKRIRNSSWKLADKLREYDSVEHLEEIMRVLFDNSIQSATERANILDEVIKKYGKLVNPAYTKHISELSNINVQLKAKGAKDKAPTLW